MAVDFAVNLMWITQGNILPWLSRRDATRLAGEQKSPDIGAGARTACRLQAGGGRNLAPAVEQFSF